ncbi:uncharacterized protein J4E92_002274 [Alternaria infectoria]|uniref:uncharacterized protein n=1 Tax=Alternaria infectoria TaxID=45303 RepID=UPI002220F4CD|nr:uncharacterized protein J4E92_002274 [Alternaria infectoria]KAI4937543.1 hypothetical protein J4E92_002274 [Alternaria infectoria]
MRSFCQLAVLALPLFSTAVAASPNKRDDHPKTIYATAQEAFQDLLNALPEESLQAALSGLKDFKNGVFESHHRGVEHVHENNPALATKLIVDAVNDLKKRQAPGNGTASATEASAPQQTTEDAPSSQASEAPPPAVETTVTQVQTQQGTTVTQVQTQTQQQTQQTQQTQQSEQPQQSQQPSDDAPPSTVTNTQQQTTTQQATTTVRQTTTQRPAIIPVEATITQDGTTVVRTTRVLSEVTASVPVTLVRTNSAGSTVTQTENRPAVIRTTTDSAGRTTVTTSAADYAPTAGEVQTATDEAGSTFLTTYTPGGGLVSSIKLITTTDAEGRPSTMTSYTFVDPIQATQASGGDGGDSTEQPSVQTGAAGVNGVPFAGAVGLGAMALFF